MTPDDVLPLRGKAYAQPAGWTEVSASSDPFEDTLSQPSRARVARVLMFASAGSVTFTSIDGGETTMTLEEDWSYPVFLEGMFTHVTAITDATVYAGWY